MAQRRRRFRLGLDEPLPPAGPTPAGHLDGSGEQALSGAVIRLLECLKRPFDSRLLDRQTVRKIIYRVLRGEQGGSLRALGRRGEHFSRIARVLKHPSMPSTPSRSVRRTWRSGRA